MSSIDALLAPTAATQHGLLTRGQVLAGGGTDSIIRRRLESGRWERVGHGVYAIAGCPWTWRRRLLALVLVLHPAAVASHRSGAKLLAVGGDGDPPFEISVPPGHAPRPLPAVPQATGTTPALIVHESTDLHWSTPVLIDGIPTTPPLRLAVDLGSVVPFERYRIAMNRLITDHGVSWIDLERQYRRHSVQGRNGCGALRDLIDLHHETTGASDELVEALCADLLVGAGLEPPVHQHPVQRPDGTMAYFDLAYPELRIAIETEGRIHLREDVHERDHARRNQLLIGGWLVLHFTYYDVTRRPQYVIDTVRAAIATRTTASA